MDKVSTIRDLVNLWPTRAALAADLRRILSSLGAENVSVSTDQVHKWAEKCSIPPKFHHSLLLAAQSRDLDVTAELIVALHSPERRAA